MDLQPIEPLIEAVPEHWRPWLLVGLALTGAIAAVLTMLKSLSEGAGWLWRSVRSLKTWLVALCRKQQPPPALGPDPDPIPEESTIWEREPVVSPLYPRWGQSGDLPIITVANMKGGVGKTTLVANLAARFQRDATRPVLVIDFDYQGSLSETFAKQAERPQDAMRAHTLLFGDVSDSDALAHARPLARGLESVEYYPARYEFATIENNIMIDWVRNPGNGDVRFCLCRYLRSTPFQKRYSMVLIDCPPRLTTGTINALCASTHLLIPTKLDEMSAEAAIYFLQQIQRMKDSLFPRLEILGIVPTMTDEAERLSDYEERARDRITFFGEQQLQRGNLLLMEQRVPDRRDIGRFAGAGVAYLRKSATRPIFDKLAEEIKRRIDAKR